MLKLDALQKQKCKNVYAVGRARVCEYTILATIFGLLFSTASYAQVERETVDFNIPSLALPQALRKFARQARVELVFAERGFESVQTTAVIGAYEKERALELLLAGTGLRVGFGSGDSVIVQRADASVSGGATSFAVGDSNSGTVLLAQAAVDGSQGSGELEAANYQAGRETAESNNKREALPLEEIRVTGSRIRGAQSAAPVVTITREAIDRAGFATVEEVIENLPQNFSAGASLDATNSANKFQAVGGDTQDFAGGTAVNLRGLGASSTLILLNGRRMSASGGAARFTSISSIPVTAIERVEVMTDGASAIYGSDAIGGVVNFILRENYDGAETRLRYGSDARGDTSNIQFAQSLGNSWDGGNILFTYEYYDSEALAASDREFTASNDLSVFGGTDWRQPGGNPAIIRTGSFPNYVSYAIPEGQDGTALSPADFIGLENTEYFFNAQSNIDTTPAVEQHSGFLHLRQAIGSVELFGAARFSTERRATRVAQAVVDFTVVGDDPTTPGIIEGNPFFVDPTDTGLTTVTVDNYALFDDFGPEIVLGEIESSGATLGAQFSFSESWQGELVGNWSKEEAPQWFGNEINGAALTAAVNRTDPGLAFNPFGDGSSTDPIILESLVDRRLFGGSSENELWSVSFNVDGDAFDVGGGVVKVATGIDFREESLFTIDSTGSIVDRSRDILAVYGEVFVPLVGNANSRKGLQRLEVSLAARYEDYSDFGDSANPKLGLLWAPTETLAFRGTIGTSYRAPSLVDLDDSGTEWRYFPGSFFGLPYSILTISGRNSSLQAEEVTTWTAGFQWNAGGLSLDATYFNVDFTGRIERPSFSPFIAAVDPRFASIRIDNPTSNQVATVVNDPIYDPDWLLFVGLGPYSAADLISGVLPVGAIVDNRLANLAQSVVTGAELQLSYLFDTNIGSFNVGFNGSYMFDFERRLLEVDQLVEEVDQIGRPVDFRARGSVTWNRDYWAVSGFVSYTDGYTDNVSSPERAVDSWTTMDLTVAYNTGNDAGFLSDTRLSLTAQNLFDEGPPFVNTSGGVGYDATNASPLGQFFSLQITKDW